jgi:hypothetical protein
MKGAYGFTSVQGVSGFTPSLYVIGPPQSGGQSIQGLYIRESVIGVSPNQTITYRWDRDANMNSGNLCPISYSGHGL